MLVAMPFRDEATLIREANDSATVWPPGSGTRDTGRALRLSEQLEAGTVWIKHLQSVCDFDPVRGFKESGLNSEKWAFRG